MEVTFFLGLLVILAFAGCGGFLIYSGLSVQKRLKRYPNWPSVGGKVISSEVVESSGTGKDGVTFSTYKPVTRFQYFVDGQEFNAIHIGPTVPQAEDPGIQRIADQFPVGGTVSVQYNPNHPAEAVLSSGAIVSRPVIVVGIVLVLVSLVISCVGMIAFLIYFFTH